MSHKTTTSSQSSVPRRHIQVCVASVTNSAIYSPLQEAATNPINNCPLHWHTPLKCGQHKGIRLEYKRSCIIWSDDKMHVARRGGGHEGQKLLCCCAWREHLSRRISGKVSTPLERPVSEYCRQIMLCATLYLREDRWWSLCTVCALIAEHQLLWMLERMVIKSDI